MYQLQHQLKAPKDKIRTWNKEQIDNVFKDKKCMMEHLGGIQRVGMNFGYDQEMKKL